MISFRFITALVTLFLLTVSCGSSPEQGPQSTPAEHSRLIIGLEDGPRTLDPRYATDAYGMRICQQLIFSSLVQLDYDLQITGDLAERWETPDSLSYIFHLREGALFHDMRPVTSKDVRFTFEHLMSTQTASPFGGVYRDKIDRIEEIDAHTVKFILKQPTASFLTAVIMPVLPSHIYGNQSQPKESDMLIGSGPFAVENQEATKISLRRFDAYFGGKPALEGIVFKVIKDDNTRFLKMNKGELDLVINGLPLNKIGEFTRPPLSALYNIIEQPGISYNYLLFNMTDPILGNPAVRQAIAYAINVREIIDYRLQGHAIAATGLLSPVNWFYEQNVQDYPYNPEKAASLLDQAGFLETRQLRFELEMKTSNNNQAIGVARIIQAQLARIGVRLQIKSYEWGTFYDDIKKGNFQITAMRWVGVTEPDFYYDIFHSSQIPPQGRNRGKYTNPELDRLVMEGRTTIAPDGRRQLYSAVQKLAAKELPYVSLWHPNTISLVHQRVAGYRQHPTGSLVSLKNVTLH